MYCNYAIINLYQTNPTTQQPNPIQQYEFFRDDIAI